MKIRRLAPALILGISLTAGCDAPDAVDSEDSGEVTLRPGTGSQGGVWLNTSTVGSQQFASFDLTGQVHGGVRLTGVKIKRPNNQWLTATAGEVVDGNLRAKVGKTVYTGADLVGSQWSLLLVDGDHDGDDDDADEEANGTPATIWIAAHTQVSPKESRYTFHTHDANNQAVPVCAADSSGSHASIPVRNVAVDPFTGDMTPRANTVYLACTSGAVGKAIDWGYRPWERSLADFEAATRMVRADYCFDGTSWTQDGTALEVRDRWSINNFLHETDPTEVVWTSSGAACVTQPRNPTYVAAQVTCNGQPLPACPAGTTMATFADTLFWTKVPTL